MRIRSNSACTRLSVALTLVFCGRITASAQTPRYTIQDLGQAAGVGSSASAVNDAGVAVGWMLTPLEDTHATRIGAGGAFELVPGLETLLSDAAAINVFGDIAGTMAVSRYPNYQSHAMRYTEARGIDDLGTLGGSVSVATGINRSGQVSGWSYLYGSGFVIRGFIATPGRPLQSLGTFGGSSLSSSFASGINDAGQVAGHAEGTHGVWHAFRYTPGIGLEDLAASSNGHSFSNDLNTSGQVVGRLFSGTDAHAFRYTDGAGMQDLHALGTTSDAVSLNDQGDVVGYFYSSGQRSRAFLYTDATGMIDLNATIDPASGWLLNAAYGINASGEIVGQGTYHGQSYPRAFKLIPVTPDTTPPTIVSSSPDPAVLWPPNDKMVDVFVSVLATDGVDPAPHCLLSDVSNNESTGESDSVITGELSVQLRAARDGIGSGRTYILGVTCADAAGNQTRATIAVRVPHAMNP